MRALKRWILFKYIPVLLFLGLQPQKIHALPTSPDTLKTFVQQQINVSLEIANLNPDSAMNTASKAFEIASQNNYEESKAELLRIMGLIWYYRGDYARALEYFLQSYNLYRIIDNPKGEASALNNISVVYRNQGYTNKALEMDLQILAMRQSLGDSTKIAASLNNVAVAYKDLNEATKALQYYHEAVSTSLKCRNPESLDLYYNNLGSLHLNQNQPDSAYYYFQKSIQISKPLNHKQMLANSYTYLGNYFMQKKRYDNAIASYRTGLKLAKEIGIIYEIEWTAEQLHAAYAMKGDYQNAYQMHVLYKQMADSAKNQATIQKITQIETSLRYSKEREFEQVMQTKKELENQLELNKQKQARNIAGIAGLALLLITGITLRSYHRKNRDNKLLREQTKEITLQNEEIQSQRDNIEALNKTKDKFFAIIAHDLKNPLGSLFKLSGMMHSDFEQMQPETTKSYLLHLNHAAEKAFILLDNLLQWSTLQLGSIQVNPKPFNLLDVMRDNTELLSEFAAQKKIEIQFQTCTECVAYADPILINTVIRNLLTNSLKFTPENGTVSLKVDLKSNFWVISVTDNGIGISSEDQKQLFDMAKQTKNIGYSKEKGTGLGLVLCKEFTELNGGSIWLESELGKGSTFFVSVPVWENKSGLI